MKIIMRRVFVIFYPENHENGNAVWRRLSNKNQRFLLDNSIKNAYYRSMAKGLLRARWLLRTHKAPSDEQHHAINLRVQQSPVGADVGIGPYGSG
ncbi:MAG: hypothetical protein ACI4PH_03985 [Faecousia sp.]